MLASIHSKWTPSLSYFFRRYLLLSPNASSVPCALCQYVSFGTKAYLASGTDFSHTPNSKGGVGLPDFKLYHRVVLLSRILEWFPRSFPKAPTMVEQDLSTLDLRALLCGYGQKLHLLSSSSPLTTAALHLWYKKGLSSLLSTDPLPFTSLFDHPVLPQGMGSNMVGQYSGSTWPVAGSFVNHTSGTPVVPRDHVNCLAALPISSFCSYLFSSSQIHRSLTSYEQL